MIEALKNILLQILVVFYQLTSLQIGGVDLGERIRSIHEYIIHSPVTYLIEIILIPVTIILIIALVRAISKMEILHHKMTAQTEIPAELGPETMLQTRWQEIVGHIDSTNEGEWKFAIIEADKLVDDILKDSFAGETMGERLMNIDKTKLLTIDGLWEAHKIRNRLAHESNYFLRHAEAVRAVRLYEQTLKELGAL